jgi:hypothetical protein
MSDDSSSIATDGDVQTPSSTSSKSRKIAKKSYSQKYNSDWEKEHPWLAKSNKDKTHFYCKCCRGDYHGGVTEIKRHELTTKQTRNASSIKRQQTILDSFNDSLLKKTKCTDLVKNVMGAFNEEKLFSLLRQQKFSLVIDETADKSTTKHLF